MLVIASPACAQDDAPGTHIGLEARARFEAYQGDVREASPDQANLAIRLMPSVQATGGPLLMYVEPIIAYRLGSGSVGPADVSGIDLLQAHASIRMQTAATTVTLGGGRTLISLGSERLVGRRYGANVPLAFSGFQLVAERPHFSLRLFLLRPVVAGPNDFDDRTSPTRKLSGAYATYKQDGSGFDLYWLDLTNTEAEYAQGSARERRGTLGARLFGARGPWSWDWEAMLQRGHLGTASIRAWSFGTETTYRRGPATMRLRANIASGDANPRDRALNTFNPLFPKAKYFGELSPIGPYNIVNLHPGLELDAGKNVTIGFAAAAYWRHRRGDGVYDLAGHLLRPENAIAPRYIGGQLEATLGWQTGPLTLAASYSRFIPGGFIRATGSARAIQMIGLEMQLSR